MSTLKADTIQSTGGGAATLTKQHAAKHHVNYDAAAGATDASFNQSSLTDQRTGEFLSNFTNAFTGAQAKTCVMSTTNSSNDGTGYVSATSRAGCTAGMGSLTGATEHLAASASAIQFYTAYNADHTAGGNLHDFDNSFCVSFGELT